MSEVKDRAEVEFFVTPGYGEMLRAERHYSQAVRIGDRVEISGQGGWDDALNFPESLTAEIERAFSLSSRAERLPPADRVDVGIVVAIKTIAMPALAYALARWGFGATDAQVLLVTVIAALPSAQNINTYAAVYRRNESLARDATLLSTAVSIPVIAAVVGLLGG